LSFAEDSARPQAAQSHSLRRRAVVLLAACAGVVGCAGLAATPALANTPAAGLGMNGWYLFWNMPQSTWNTQVAGMAADGIKVVRADALWSNVEPTAPTASGPTYNWSTTDAIATALAQHGIQWLPIIDYSTSWNASEPGDLQSPPTSDSAYAAYAAAVVARYGPGGSFWKANPKLTAEPVTAVEIWNEPNVTGTAIPAAQYAAMYESARTAIHQVSPSVEAIVGGLGNPAGTYIQQVQQTLGGPGYIDAVGQTPYDQNADDVLEDIAGLRLSLDEVGDANVPIDIEEFGWPTSGSASYVSTVSDSTRASYMTTVISDLASSDCGVERILPYTWVTAQQNAGDTEDWYGVTNDGAATATSRAIAAQYASIEAKPEPGSAAFPLCGRPVTLTLAKATPPSSQYNFCVQATADTYGPNGWATVGISGATITFTKPSAQVLITNASGVATACWSEPSVSAQTATATASDPQFYAPQASASATLVSATVSALPTVSKLLGFGL
jgi:Cellulase (glycosyl hydrolase family 5)